MSIQIVMMLPPDAGSVSLARHTVAEALRNLRVAPDCIHEAQVALSEACTNVFRRISDGQNFEVLINIGEQELTMHILDTGSASRGRHLLDWPDGSEQTAREMALMTAFADHTSFDVESGNGAVRLKKLLRWANEVPTESAGSAPA